MFDLEYLRAMTPGYDINYVPESVSTNTELMASVSARTGSVLIAGRQSAGRGRMERAFSSPEGGLYMSVLLTPANIEEAMLVTPRAAVAVSRAIERISGRAAEIKWVNDIIIGGKKACGILAEARAGESLVVVLGIGVNVSSVPAGLENIAGAVFDEAPELAREKLAAAILSELQNDGDVYAEYARRCMTPGKTITVRQGDRTFAGRALGVDRSFNLVVECNDEIIALNSGEVTTQI